MEQESKPIAGQNPPIESPKSKRVWRKPTLHFTPLHVATQQPSQVDSAGGI